MTETLPILDMSALNAGKPGAVEELARQIGEFPQLCLRGDRRSSYDQWSMPIDDALAHETEIGLATIRSGETLAGARRFAGGEGRHGSF